MKLFAAARISAIAVLVFLAAPLYAATTSFAFLVDSDANSATGCSVATTSATLAGFELRVTVPVTTNATAGTVGALSVQTCSGGVFGSASSFSPGGWPVGVDLGASASEVIEAFLPLSLLGSSSSARIAVVSSADEIGPGTVALGGVAPVANVPTLSPLAMVLLAVGLALFGLRFLRPGPGAAVFFLVLLAGTGVAWAAIAARDGNPADWAGVAPLGTDPVGDAPLGADLVALFARQDGANLELRVDARLAFDGGAAAVARVATAPAGLLLTRIGGSGQLSAVAFDAQGNVLNVPITWTSSDPAAVTVDSAGTVRAAVPSGTALITASAGTVHSVPVYVYVAAPVAGALLLTDSQIVSGPTPVDPAAEPDPDNAYEVVLRGVPSMPVGTILINTGALVVGGRVVDVLAQGSDLRVRLVVVPPQELFTDFAFKDTVDLTTVPFETPPDIAALYDVVQTGNTFVFTPKPGAAKAVPQKAQGGPAEGTQALPPLPPFSECKADLGFGSGLPVPLSLSAQPAFTVTVNGSLVNEVTPQGRRVLVRGTPTFTLSSELEIRSAFEAKIECKATLQRRKVRVPGWAGLFFGGDVEFGVGFEVAGKVTLASAKVGGSAVLNTTIEAGVSCPTASACALTGNATASSDLTPKFETPSLGQLRFEPSVNLFGFVAGELGNADVEQLQFKAIEAKAGAKLGASYTLEALQIDNTDPSDGRSKYSLGIEGEVGPGIKLGEFLEYVGIADFVPIKLTFAVPLGESPTGSATVDKATYLTGDRINMRVRLNPASTLFPAGTLYNVNRVVAVRKSGAFTTQALATQTALNGQTDFTLAFDSPAFLTAGELFAFVVPRFIPLDPPKLEIGGATVAVQVTVSPASVTLAPAGTQQFTASVTGAANQAVTWTASGGSITPAGLYTAPSVGGTHTVTATSVADGSATGTATVAVSGVTIAVNPASVSLAQGATQQFTATVTGATSQAVTWTATAGTISATGFYTAPNANGTQTVTARSVQVPTATGSATVVVGTAPIRGGYDGTSTSDITGCEPDCVPQSRTERWLLDQRTASEFFLIRTIPPPGPCLVVGSDSCTPAFQMTGGSFQVTSSAGNTVSGSVGNGQLHFDYSFICGTNTGVGTCRHTFDGTYPIQVAPASLDFGTVTVGQSSTRIVTITNTGPLPVRGGLDTFPSGSAFSVINNSNCLVSLAGGATCQISVRFAPIGVATFTHTMVINTEVNLTGGDQVPMRGVGN